MIIDDLYVRSLSESAPLARLQWGQSRRLTAALSVFTLEIRMEVTLTPDQQALVSDAIASGRLHRPEDAMQQALLLWEERERRRLEILAAVELSTASLARGEGRTVTSREESDQLVNDITRRGMARLAAGQNQRG